jgi:hypothetical protein
MALTHESNNEIKDDTHFKGRKVNLILARVDDPSQPIKLSPTSLSGEHQYLERPQAEAPEAPETRTVDQHRDLREMILPGKLIGW